MYAASHPRRVRGASDVRVLHGVSGGSLKLGGLRRGSQAAAGGVCFGGGLVRSGQAAGRLTLRFGREGRCVCRRGFRKSVWRRRDCTCSGFGSEGCRELMVKTGCHGERAWVFWWISEVEGEFDGERKHLKGDEGLLLVFCNADGGGAHCVVRAVLRRHTWG